MTVSIRGAELAGPSLQNEALGSYGPLEIAPAPAPGVIVYWAIVDSSAQYGTLNEGPRLDSALMFEDVFESLPEHLQRQRELLQAEQD